MKYARTVARHVMPAIPEREREEVSVKCEAPGCAFETDDDGIVGQAEDSMRFHWAESHAIVDTAEIDGHIYVRFASEEDFMLVIETEREMNCDDDCVVGTWDPNAFGWYVVREGNFWDSGPPKRYVSAAKAIDELLDEAAEAKAMAHRIAARFFDGLR